MKLLTQVLSLIAAHRGPLLRVLLPLYLGLSALLFVAWYGLSIVYFSEPFPNVSAPDHVSSGFLAILTVLLVAGIGQVVLAVIWHRIVLVPDRFAPSAGQVGFYIWSVITLGIMIFVSVGLPAIAVNLLGLRFFVSSETGLLIWQAVGISFYILGSWLWLRAGLVLPDAALGNNDLNIPDSMSLTRARGGDVFIVAILQLALIELAERAAGLAYQVSDIAGPAALLFLWPLGPLVGLAALTAMYQDAMAESTAVE